MIRQLLGMTLLVISSVALAQSESLQMIRTTVHEFVIANHAEMEDTELSVTIGKLDPRLRLNKCDSPLDAFLPSGHHMTNMTTVGVKCNSNKPWTLYVPVKVRLQSEVVVANRPLARGEIISANDLSIAKKDLNLLRYGYFRTFDGLSGKRVKNSISAGRIITPKLITQPIVIKRGQAVNIIAKTKQVEVRMNGVAMQNGAVGEHIQVKNVSSNKIVHGVVTAGGDIKVTL